MLDRNLEERYGVPKRASTQKLSPFSILYLQLDEDEWETLDFYYQMS